jgi:single-strand DNA-binding protein
MINKVTLIGNLGKDPEVRRLDNGSLVAKFSLATNENYKDKNGEWKTATEWHDIIVWRKLAEKAEQTIKKGDQIFLDGKLTHRKWEDSNGTARKNTEVVANYFRKLNKSARTSDFPAEEPAYMQPQIVPADEQQSLQTQLETIPQSEDDDLPF